MSYIRKLTYLYLTLVVVLVATLFGLLIFADQASFPQAWLDESVARVLDMIKFVVGAAAGSISSAFVMLMELNKKNQTK